MKTDLHLCDCCRNVLAPKKLTGEEATNEIHLVPGLSLVSKNGHEPIEFDALCPECESDILKTVRIVVARLRDSALRRSIVTPPYKN